MAKTVEFYFDYISPASYLAHIALPDVAKRTGAEIVYKPFLLGGVFHATGNSTPISIPAKGKWLIDDLQRFAKRYNVPFVLNPNFPFKTLNLMRGAIWLRNHSDLKRYSDTMFKAIWAEQKNLADEREIDTLLIELSINPNDFKEAVARQEIKDQLRKNTDEAVQRGAFGAPTMFVDKEMFWGQDRLDFVEEALT
jgi:2-hydroxychromene-2-carboxylate isomerase